MKRLVPLVCCLSVLGATSSVATAQHISRVDGQMTEYRAASVPRLNVGDRGFAALRSTSAVGLLRVPTTAEGTGMSQRIAAEDVLSKLQGAVYDYRSEICRLSPLSDVYGNMSGFHRFVTPAQLAKLVDQWTRLRDEKVHVDKNLTLSGGDLNTVVLPNGWHFQFLAENNYALINPRTGQGVRIWGDPHLNKIESGRSSEHIDDFSSAVMCFVIQDGGEPLVIVAKSTGGDARNGFGLPTTLLALGRSKYFYVEGLNTKTPSGVKGEGAPFAYQAYADDVDAAHVMYWTSVGEFRTAAGMRAAPPASAANYAVAVPSVKVGPAEIMKIMRLADDRQDDDLEVYERIRIAYSAKTSTLSPVVTAADGYLKLARPYIDEQVKYLTSRQRLLDELAPLTDELHRIHEELRRLGLTPDEVKQLEAEAARLLEQVKALMKKLEELAPPDAVAAEVG